MNDPLPLGTSLVFTAQAVIREGIIGGTYAPGDHLRERELSDELGVSRVPVREALRGLEHEGFVTILPRRGAVVREMSLDDVDELFDLRCALEPLAAGAAAKQYANGFSHEGLDQAVHDVDKASASKDAHWILVANAEFHTQLVVAARHQLLSDVLPAILARTRWLFAQTATRSADEQTHEHHQVYEAIRAGEARLAEAYMLAHVEAGRRPSLHLIGTLA